MLVDVTVQNDFFRLHTGAELFRVESPAGDAILKQLWHHSDAIMCCSVKTNVITCFAFLTYYLCSVGSEELISCGGALLITCYTILRKRAFLFFCLNKLSIE